MKSRQAAKIGELVEALESSGFDTVAAQAQMFGLSRSTMWVIRKHNHKSSGLSARVINCMSSSRQVPALVRAKIIEYIAEKTAGLYGHCRAQRRRFVAQLNAELVEHVHLANN
jgi:oligoribonuclease (3'-5' exoribonuclease)